MDLWELARRHLGVHDYISLRFEYDSAIAELRGWLRGGGLRYEPAWACSKVEPMVRAALEVARRLSLPMAAVYEAVARDLDAVDFTADRRAQVFSCYLHGIPQEVAIVLRWLFPNVGRSKISYTKARTEDVDVRQARPDTSGVSRHSLASYAGVRAHDWGRGHAGRAHRRGRARAVISLVSILLLTVLLLKMGTGWVERLPLQIGLFTQETPQSTIPPITWVTPPTSAETTRSTTTSVHTHMVVPPITPTTYVATARSSPTVGAVDRSKVITAVYEELNIIRKEMGIPEVKLLDAKTPQYRAEYMLKTGVFSHYDLEGRHPGYYWTKLDGGMYSAEENLGYTYCIGGPCIRDPISKGVEHVHGMVYRDAMSMWGHRDSLLDPCNNYVSIGVAWNSSALYLAIYMVSKWVEWIEPPRYERGVFTAKGYVELPPEDEFYGVFIYRADKDPSYVHRHSYSYGEIYAGILPKDYRSSYVDIKTIYADRFTVERVGGRYLLDLQFRFEPDGPGLYTIIIFAKNTLGVNWTSMSPGGDSRLKYCEIVTYTFESSG